MQHIGALTGIVAWKFSGRTVTDWFGQLVSYERSDRRWSLLLELYVVGLIAYHLLPLDLTLNVGEIGKKYLDGKITIIPFQNFNGASIDWLYLVRDIAIYIPMGAFITTWMRKGSAPRSFAKTICLGFVFSLCVGSDANCHQEPIRRHGRCRDRDDRNCHRVWHDIGF